VVIRFITMRNKVLAVRIVGNISDRKHVSLGVSVRLMLMVNILCHCLHPALVQKTVSQAK